jgi:hypothetical protein
LGKFWGGREKNGGWCETMAKWTTSFYKFSPCEANIDRREGMWEERMANR